MASLSDVLSAALAVKNAIAAGEVVNAWEHTLPLQQFAIEAARAAGFKASPGDAKTKADITACLRECETLAQAHPAMTAAGPQPVGKIGDGKILELLLKILALIGPIFI